jgi:hypothetical protein
MIVLGGALIGGALGAFTAKKRGGSALDIAQYAASSAIACGLLGLIATIVIHRAAV